MPYYSIVTKVAPGLTQAGTLGAVTATLANTATPNGKPMKVRTRASTQTGNRPSAGSIVVRVNRRNWAAAQDALAAAGLLS